MTLKKSRNDPPRIQGTDGIRREVRRASSLELEGRTPQQVFLEQGFITEEFMELYAYCHVMSLKKNRRVKKGSEFVVGWDPRDAGGRFTQAVVRGVQKAGLTALVLGVVPTPLVPLYMLHRKAAGGFMVTASHNPKDQNGIKTFLAFRGMKLLPDDDIKLTQAVLNTSFRRLAKASLTGKRLSHRRQALDLFKRFSMAPENAWTDFPPDESISFKDIHLVVDPANGSLAQIAAKVFLEMGFGKVLEVNNSLDGNVNFRSGVADLEGHSLIAPAMVFEKSGVFYRHQAVKKLFQWGRKNKLQIQNGRRKVSGAIFDADGDRFDRLDYDPFKDALLVLSGDETAFLQARFLLAKDPKRYRGSLYINTVESDLGAQAAAEKLGFTTCLTGVGDKWILLKLVRMIAETRLRNLRQVLGFSDVLKKIQRSLPKKGAMDARGFEQVEQALDREKKKLNKIPEARLLDSLNFAVGSEETGHNITLGHFQSDINKSIPVFFGNGLKSALNTFSATQKLFQNKPVRTYFSGIHRPFKPGFKQTLYVYYIQKELFHKNSFVWRKVKQAILDEALGMGLQGKTVVFPEDADMLYVSLNKLPNSGGPSAIFIRNSGTENKISVNLRCDKKSAASLKKIGEKLIPILISTLKDGEERYAKLERDIIRQVATGAKNEKQLSVEENAKSRLLSEMGKQGLMRHTAKGYRLTPLGEWYHDRK